MTTTHQARVLIAGSDYEDWHEAQTMLTEMGYDVINAHPCSLRVNVGLLSTADAICLLDDWWTDTGAVCLQTIAAWLRLLQVSSAGEVFETRSLRG